ncbi:MAG: diadenylate cyclase CdaA [bacterium]|nr:diadenylate cyclase CdaA [bacterium]MDD6225583.1 diadenylate cyclase CdaA [bacterium]MDY3861700.1 diadenylate cyclase CdaA [Ruminococcus sp.]
MDTIKSLFLNILSVFNTIQIKDILDIIVIAIIIFSLFQLVRQTRAEQLLKGVIVLLLLYFIANIFGLTMLSTLLMTFFQSAVVLIAIVFQPEIRKALEKLGRSKMGRRYIGFLSSKYKDDEESVKVKNALVNICDAAALFSRSKTGALIVFERTTKLSDIASSGTVVNARTSVALLGNMFFNKAPLHDGAVIIRDGVVYAAGCILPLTENKSVDINLGTRHRAALGISEQSDCVALVVSEETGNISLAVDGKLTRDYTRETLYEKLEDLLIESDELTKKSFFSFFKRKEKDENEKE